MSSVWTVDPRRPDDRHRLDAQSFRWAHRAAWLASILIAGPLVAFSIACGATELGEGKPAPTVRAELLHGGTFDSAHQRGKVIVINFWASWCKPCREEMPALDAFYRAHRAEGLEVIAITIEGSEDLGRINAAMKGFSFPAALAANAETAGYGRPWRLPMTFVIDRRGVLRFDGWKVTRTLDLATLNRVVMPLLREGQDGLLADSSLR